MATLNYFIRNVYGKQTIYPHGELADAVKTLTRRATLTVDDMDALRMLGVNPRVVQDPDQPTV